MSHEWAEHFRALLRAKGYEPVDVHHDSSYGWLVNFREPTGDEGGYIEHEFERATTVGVERKIALLDDLTGGT